MNVKLLIAVVAAGVASHSVVFAQAQTKLKPSESFSIKIAGVPPEDVIAITDQYDIAADGKFSLPYVGRITAANLTPAQLGIRIEEAYKAAEIFTRPTVNVSTQDKRGPAAGRKITINGEVKVPSRALWTDGMTLLDAIASAGGFTDWADKGKVRLLRNGKTSSHDVRKISQNPELDVVLKPNDRVIVIHR